MNPVLFAMLTTTAAMIVVDIQGYVAAIAQNENAPFKWKLFVSRVLLGLLTGFLTGVGVSPGGVAGQ